MYPLSSYAAPCLRAAKIKDGDFPENSTVAATNYCRNPIGDKGGPFCIVRDWILVNDGGLMNAYCMNCSIPICPSELVDGEQTYKYI